LVKMVLMLNAIFYGILFAWTLKESKEWTPLPFKGKVVTREDKLVVSLSQYLENAKIIIEIGEPSHEVGIVPSTSARVLVIEGIKESKVTS